jgi:urease accessory protein
MMTAMARLLEQRSIGEVKLRLESHGVAQLREAGALKVRIPPGSHEAILINTGGGIAGGDAFAFDISVGENAHLTVTSQAAERVYRTLGPAASIKTSLRAELSSTLFWLPQETIIYDGAALRREYSVHLDAGAAFLAVEPIVFGRREMGETVKTLRLNDNWRIWRSGKLAHADALEIGPEMPVSPASLGNARAIAAIICVAEDAEGRLDAVRETLGPLSGASAWNGKLIARLLAEDGFMLRKQIISALRALAGAATLPRIWTM